MKVTELPAVASNFYTHCKKCDADRYHKVLSHSSAIAAKLECEVCQAKSTFKLTTAKKKVTRKTVKKVDQGEVYANLEDKIGVESLRSYNMKDNFSVDTAIEHPKFGVGFITGKSDSSIEVVFSDATKNLVHNRI